MWPFSKKKKPAAKRAYAGAMYGRLVADWIAQGTSGDAEIRSSLHALRNRSRDLARNNDYVRNFLRTVQNNVVGQGIPFQSQVRMQRGGKLNDALNHQIENAWYKWSKKENCDVAGKLCFSEIERLVIRSIAESGEVIVRKIFQPMGPAGVPFALELVEADMLDDFYNGIADNGNEIRMGVEINQWKRPVAYYFYQKHPGDYQSLQVQPRTNQRIRIPAEEIIHLFISDRVSQTRGVPWIASAIMRLHHMHGYEEAEVIAARASAAVMGFIESPEVEPSIKDDVVQNQSVTEFEPGVFKKLDPGEKIETFNPNRPGGQFDPFMRLMLRGFAAGAGASYESLSRDYSQSNYSSSRLALLDDRDNWRSLQRWLIYNFHQEVLESFLDMAVLSGRLQLKDYETSSEAYQSVKWMPRGWSWVDPLKEVNAYRQAVRSGFMTQADVVAQSGSDIDELLTQRQREIELADEMNLVFDTDPSKVAATGVAQPDTSVVDTANQGSTQTN